MLHPPADKHGRCTPGPRDFAHLIKNGHENEERTRCLSRGVIHDHLRGRMASPAWSAELSRGAEKREEGQTSRSAPVLDEVGTGARCKPPGRRN